MSRVKPRRWPIHDGHGFGAFGEAALAKPPSRVRVEEDHQVGSDVLTVNTSSRNISHCTVTVRLVGLMRPALTHRTFAQGTVTITENGWLIPT